MVRAASPSGTRKSFRRCRDGGTLTDVMSPSSLVHVDHAACERVAKILRVSPVPDEREDSPLTGFSRGEIGNFYLFTVAICHQTSPIGRAPLQGELGGALKRGWDYLTARFEVAVHEDRKLLTPHQWRMLRGPEMAALFRDRHFGDLLTKPDERAELIRDLGDRMTANDWRFADDLFAVSGGRVGSGQGNLLGLLQQFRAYRDPIRKKSLFFLALMRNHGLWKYVDEELLGAPVDYHEVRGHLRLGTVKVDDPGLSAKLRDQREVTEEEDLAIRGAVSDAITVIFGKGLLRSPSQAHYLFWNVFRSCCTREEPHCRQCPPACPLPERYVRGAVEINGTRRCLFSSACESAHRDRRFFEHVFETDYY